VLGSEDRDHASLLIDGVQHPVAAPACRPATSKLTLQRLPDPTGLTQEVAGNELDRRRCDRLRQVVRDGSCSWPGNLEPEGLFWRLGHPSASPLGHEVSQPCLVDDVAGGDGGFALTQLLHGRWVR